MFRCLCVQVFKCSSAQVLSEAESRNCGIQVCKCENVEMWKYVNGIRLARTSSSVTIPIQQLARTSSSVPAWPFNLKPIPTPINQICQEDLIVCLLNNEVRCTGSCSFESHWNASEPVLGHGAARVSGMRTHSFITFVHSWQSLIACLFLFTRMSTSVPIHLRTNPVGADLLVHARAHSFVGADVLVRASSP